MIWICLIAPAAAVWAQHSDEPIRISPQFLDVEPMAMPAPDTVDYWVIRDRAMNQIIPAMTQSRAHLKDKHRQMFDYLLEIHKADHFADQQIKGICQTEMLASLLELDDQTDSLETDILAGPPQWDVTVEMMMQQVLDEGFVPERMTEPNAIEALVRTCRRKGRHGRKIFETIPPIISDCSAIWTYLENADLEGAFKVYVTRVEREKAQARQDYRDSVRQAHREEVIARARQRKQQEFNLRQASTRRARRERFWRFQEELLKYLITQMESRMANSYYQYNMGGGYGGYGGMYGRPGYGF
jgi:hypothetical protein